MPRNCRGFKEYSISLAFIWFWWQHLAAGRSLKFPSCRNGLCRRNATAAIQSGALGRTPNIPIERRLIYRRLALRSIPTTPASSPCKNGRLLLRRWHIICNGLDKFFSPAARNRPIRFFLGADPGTDISAIHGPITDISNIVKSCFPLHYQKYYVFYALHFFKNFKNQKLWVKNFRIAAI